MTYFYDEIKQKIKELIASALDREIDFDNLEIVKPPENSMGDLSVPCFYLSKLTRISPNQIAIELKQKIKLDPFFRSIETAGPYLNFYLAEDILAENVIKEIYKNKDKYGQLPMVNEKLMIEYSQPNTHKEFHVGHLRNVILGSALVNLQKFNGKKVIPANYIGDIGSHVAKCLWAYDKFHKDEPEPKEHKGQYLGKIYTEAVKLCEENEDYKKEASEVQQKLEAGDKYFTALWKKTREWSLEEFKNIYKILGAEFDEIFYESQVEKPGKEIVKELLEKKIAEHSQGAVIIDLEKYDLKQFLLLKSDGSSLYSTKELALAKLKFEKYKIDSSYIVVDARQSFYFKQFFKTLEVMGFKKDTRHISYEFVTLPEGAMSSRSGNIILFEDFFKEVFEMALVETAKRHTDWTEEENKSNAEKIALSAIKFSMIKTGRNNVIVFDPKEALSFDGFTGPYLQYTVTRINSILRKEKIKSLTNIDFSKLDKEKEKELLLSLAKFSQVIKSSAEALEPSQLAKYLFDLAKIFSSYYQEVPILNSETDDKLARLALILAIKQVLENGLKILGIESLERM